MICPLYQEQTGQFSKKFFVGVPIKKKDLCYKMLGAFDYARKNYECQTTQFLKGTFFLKSVFKKTCNKW